MAKLEGTSLPFILYFFCFLKAQMLCQHQNPVNDLLNSNKTCKWEILKIAARGILIVKIDVYLVKLGGMSEKLT